MTAISETSCLSCCEKVTELDFFVGNQNPIRCTESCQGVDCGNGFACQTGNFFLAGEVPPYQMIDSGDIVSYRCLSDGDIEELLLNFPTAFPTSNPSPFPTLFPTTPFPSASPTVRPTPFPSASPTVRPTPFPTISPTPFPFVSPTVSPTNYPTASPTNFPTLFPIVQPPSATQPPLQVPTPSPSISPTKPPTQLPTEVPTVSPSGYPTVAPSLFPTSKVTNAPTNFPTVTTPSPTNSPTLSTESPTASPTRHPTDSTLFPTLSPSFSPVTASPTVTTTVSTDPVFLGLSTVQLGALVILVVGACIVCFCFCCVVIVCCNCSSKMLPTEDSDLIPEDKLFVDSKVIDSERKLSAIQETVPQTTTGGEETAQITEQLKAATWKKTRNVFSGEPVIIHLKRDYRNQGRGDMAIPIPPQYTKSGDGNTYNSLDGGDSLEEELADVFSLEAETPDHEIWTVVDEHVENHLRLKRLAKTYGTGRSTDRSSSHYIDDNI